MWLIAGTVPEKDFPLYTDGIWADSHVENAMLVLPDAYRLPVSRGTTALAATAIKMSKILSATPPRLLLTGDCGTGTGSKKAYAWLSENLAAIASHENLQGITFHYFYPDLDAHNKLYLVLEELMPRPILVADAGFMYVAKMSGYAASYDLFTPDMGELAFLADEKAPHPFYTRGFLLAEEGNVPKLIERALTHGNCPANMIVKGKTDYVLCAGKMAAEVDSPSVPAMECIGGTGDIVAGFATAYLAVGYPVCESIIKAVRAARYLALFCQPDPSTQVDQLISKIEPMFAEYGAFI